MSKADGGWEKVKIEVPINNIKTVSESCPSSAGKECRLIFISSILAIIFLTGLTFAASHLVGRSASPAPISHMSEFTETALSDVIPETTERIVFLSMLLLAPFVALLAYLIARKMPSALIPASMLEKWGYLSLALLAAVWLNSWALWSKYLVNAGFDSSFAGIFLFASGLLVFICIFWNSRLVKLSDEIVRKRFKYLAIAVMGACMLIAVSFRLFDWKTFMICSVSTPYYQMFQMEPCTYHINPVLYYMPLAEAGCHITSLGAPLYGFYASYLIPVFKLTGLTVFSFSFVLTLFYLLGAVAIITPVFMCLKNPYLKLLLVPVLCAVQGALSQVSLRWDPYFQYYPVRFLTPSLAVLFIYLIIRAGKSGIWLTAIFSFILGFLIFWNFDSGITTVVAWLIFFLLFAFVETIKRRGLAHRASYQMLAAAAMLVLGACTFMFILSLSERDGISFDSLLKIQRIYYLTGFSMLPIPRSLHPWMAVLAVYLISVLVTLPSILQAGSKCSCRRQLLFFISVLGTGLFSYYQGRSHDMVLPMVTWPAFLCCFLACDWFFSVDDVKKMSTMRFLALPFMILCISLSLRLAMNSPWYLERIALLNYSLTSNELNSKTLPFQSTVKWLAGFKSEPPGSVLIISQAESLFYVESGLRPLRMLPSEQERFILRRQEEEVLKLIRSGSVRHLFMTPYWINTPEQNRLMEAIVTNYKREETPSTLLLRHWTFKGQ